MAEERYVDHVNNTYGAEWQQLVADALYGAGVSASEGWSRLASYYAKHGESGSAQWCGMMASGASYDQADAVFKTKEQAQAGMKPIIEVPEFGL